MSYAAWLFAPSLQPNTRSAQRVFGFNARCTDDRRWTMDDSYRPPSTIHRPPATLNLEITLSYRTCESRTSHPRRPHCQSGAVAARTRARYTGGLQRAPRALRVYVELGWRQRASRTGGEHRTPSLPARLVPVRHRSAGERAGYRLYLIPRYTSGPPGPGNWLDLDWTRLPGHPCKSGEQVPAPAPCLRDAGRDTCPAQDGRAQSSQPEGHSQARREA